MAGASQYDDIAEQYRRSKFSPLRTYIEAYTFLNLIGDVRGKRVLDLACGEGFYSRRLKTLGADRVVGVDVTVHKPEAPITVPFSDVSVTISRSR